ncbi:MAG: hypothetical protein ABSB59_28045 [Streptosporangiaceae bacterium]|jgi:hypothetical protein
MVNFTVLGDVTASWDEDAATLQPQQKHLLARLVYAGGRRVPRPDLMRALSLRGRPDLPDGGLRRVAAELRKALKPVMPDQDPVPSGDQGYRLVLQEQQADMFRFRAKRDEALLTAGPAGVTLMRAALKEWGSAEVGLFGRCALRGFSGDWAARTRAELEDEHRRAVIYCLRQQFDAGHYREVLVECHGRATEDDQEQLSRTGPQLQVTLLDLDFIELWMRAAHRCGQPTEAEDIGQRALGAAERFDKQADFALKRLVERVREEETSDAANTRPRASARKDRGAVSETGSTFNFYNDGATIQSLTGQVGTVNYYARPEQAGENSRADNDEAADGD